MFMCKQTQMHATQFLTIAIPNEVYSLPSGVVVVCVIVISMQSISS